MKIPKLSWTCLGLALMAGCAPIYVAPSANAPMFGSGGELHAALQVESLGGMDLQAAFSPFDHFGIQLGLSLLPEYSDEDEHHHYYGELGLGGYVPFGIGRFEAFVGGGYGKGWGELDYGEGGTNYRGDGTYGRVYVQADIGLATRIVDFGLMSRWCWVTYDYIGSNGALTAQDPFIEEILFLRLGYDPVKVELQGGFIWPTANDIQIGWIPWHFSIGLHVKFDLWGDDGEEPKSTPSGEDQDGGWHPTEGLVPRWW